MTETSRDQELLDRYSTREMKLRRIREIERKLEKWEGEDEVNDPDIIRGHIGLTRGSNMGCGAFMFCCALACWSVWHGGRSAEPPRYGWALALVITFSVLGAALLLRGLLYRPDPQAIVASYEPYRMTAEYREIVEEMEILARALSQDLRAEDLGPES